MLNIDAELQYEFETQGILRERIQKAYSQQSLLEAKFKKLSIQYQKEAYSKTTTDGAKTTVKPTEAKLEAEHRLSLEPQYEEYLQSPIIVEGLYRELKIAECRVRTLERIIEKQRRLPKL